MRLTPVRAAVAAATAVLVGIPAVATSDAPAPAEPTGLETAAGAPSSGARVTLVTGDVAELVTLPNGSEEAHLVGPGSSGGSYSFTQGRDAYVLPASAQALLAEGKVDLELFNVSELVDEGYDDGVPVIVDYETPRGVAPDRALSTPDGIEQREALPSIGAVAGRTVAEDGDAFWTDVSADAAGAVEKVWYDAPIEATLDESAQQIGAPAAWERGLTGKGVTIATLDTGVDTSHPDFEGRIAATADFTGGDSVADVFGHGTHVASIAAGSGAASDGQYRGIASEAELLVGKILGDDGTGSTSAAIEGMEWAVAHDADIVNMSLGGPVTNGDDPMSQAADRLTAEHGTLFVAASGNHSIDNPGMSFVTSPASAASALAVGASGRDPDQLWDSTSRGRMDGEAIKPEISAPGVNITAAGSADAGYPAYVSGTGTSMAAPHVAGAAALLKQLHPDWEAEELRDALTSTAAPMAPHRSVYEQGAGRVDLDRATRQGVYVDAGTLQLGYFARPYGELTTTRTLTYRNESDAPVDLDLATELRAKQHDTAPADALTVRPASLHLRPGESGAVQVSLDARSVEPDTYSGYVTATGGKVRLSTAVGFYKQDDMIDLTLRALDRRGRPAVASVRISEYKETDGRYNDSTVYLLSPQQTEYKVRLPEGDYSVWSDVQTFDASGEHLEEVSLVGNPRLRVQAPNFEVTLDARDAVPLELDTPRPAETRGVTMNWWRGQPGTTIFSSDKMILPVGSERGPDRVSVTPTAEVQDAPFGLITSFAAEGPPQPDGYAYDLSFAELGRVPNDLSYRVRERDVAAVRTTVYSSGTGERGWLLHQSKFDACACSAPELERFLPQAGVTRTEYLPGGDDVTTIAAWLYLYDLQGDLLYSRGPGSYQAGKRYQEEWLKAPYSPGVPQSAIRAAGRSPVSTRDDDRLYYSLAAFTDAAGHWTPGFLPATSSSRVYLDGEQIHENKFALTGTLTVPQRPGTYRIEADVDHDGSLVGLSTQTRTAWTFRSAQTAESKPLPLIDVDYVDIRRAGTNRSALDPTNAAARNARVELVLAATHQEGSTAPAVRELSVEVSYDDGATWEEATVVGSRGDFVARYRHAKIGDDVSLRIHASDGAGGELDQTLVRAYRLR
jgi:subtilisin family serine protease